MFYRTVVLWSTALLCSGAKEVRPGVWAGQQVAELPLPSTGYQVYMVGELHGVQENEAFQLQYLEKLQSSIGVRDVAIEEDAVYEEQAQAFVEGRAETLPEALCLRAGILNGIRRMNSSNPKALIRVHLIDVDSPASAIRQHLLSLKKRIDKVEAVEIPGASDIRQRGLAVVVRLKRLAVSPSVRTELRTVEHSIRANKEGLEVGIGRPKGSPYLEDREQAITSNIEDLVSGSNPLLVLYGSDHLSRRQRKDGGPQRDQPLWPVAHRLEQAGIKIYTLITFPLSGRSFWRGDKSELPWMASDGRLASGETLDKVLAAVPEAQYLFVDAKRERARVPSQDVSNYGADSYVLFRSATEMTNYCALR